MHLVFIRYHINSDKALAAQTKDLFSQYLPIQENKPDNLELRISVVQRSTINKKIKQNGITIYLHKDEFAATLRWCDNPVTMHNLVASLTPDVVHLYDLSLPLHFRWLRNALPAKTGIIGEHTGERIWIQLRLFLQQFGLRAADAFIFSKLSDADRWLKSAAILPSQPIFEIPSRINSGARLQKYYATIQKVY